MFYLMFWFLVRILCEPCVPLYCAAGTTSNTAKAPSAFSSTLRLLFSAPRRATVTVTVIVLGLIMLTAARSAHGPDPEKVLSALSEKAYAYNGQVCVFDLLVAAGPKLATDRFFCFIPIMYHRNRFGPW